MRPIIINNFLHSSRILGDACEKFSRFTVEGTRLNRDRIDEMLGRSLMLVTALAPVIGYEKASAIAHKANDEGLTLKEAALRSGEIDETRLTRSSTRKRWLGAVLLAAEAQPAAASPQGTRLTVLCTRSLPPRRPLSLTTMKRERINA
jgi:fumarate hydratase class II